MCQPSMGPAWCKQHPADLVLTTKTALLWGLQGEQQALLASLVLFCFVFCVFCVFFGWGGGQGGTGNLDF